MKRLQFSGPRPFLPSALSIFILLACAPAFPAGEPNEAEKLFRDMEKKLKNAKTIECRFEGKTEFSNKNNNEEFKGTILLGEGNKCYLEGSLNVAGMTYKGATICDGSKMRLLPGGKPISVPDAQKDLNAKVRAALALTGMRWTGPEGGRHLHNLTTFSVTGQKPKSYTLGKKTVVGGKEAQQIDYFLPNPAALSDGRVSLWLDAKTNLPLIRRLSFSNETFTEKYTDWILDGKIDDKKFELPKE